MSNPTTPFGWQMPQNTDLVTDLPADFEVFGQAVATSMQDLLGGTTGQVLAKASNADMDFVWSADAAGMTNPMTTTGDVIYSSPGSTPVRLGIGSTGQGLSVVAGIPAWTASATSTLTTTGDMLYASAANTLERRAVGTTGQVLTVAGGLPTWATPGGSTKSYALLSTTSLTGASTTISSLSGYDNFFILVRGASSTVANRSLVMKINAISTSANYREMGGRVNAPSTYSAAGLLEEINYFENNGQLYIGKMGNNVSSTISGFIQIAGANTSGTKVLNYGTTGSDGGSNSNAMSLLGSISKDSAVVSSLTFNFDSGDLDAGTVYIYGAA